LNQNQVKKKKIPIKKKVDENISNEHKNFETTETISEISGTDTGNKTETEINVEKKLKSKKGVKRKRMVQSTLLNEWGKFSEFQNTIGELIDQITDDTVLIQMRHIMMIIKQAQLDGRGCLDKAAQQDHIIDQCKELARFLPEIKPQDELYVFYRLIKRAALACDSQSGCERANSVYNIFKNDLSSVMKLPMVSARLRIHQNGPPLSKFNPLPVRQLWLRKGHQMAATVAEKKLVIERIKQKDAEYTSHIFD